MKVAFLCSGDISNQIFIQTLKKYDLELLVYVENNEHNKKNIIKKKLKKLNLLGKLLFPLDILSLFLYKKNMNKYLKNSLEITSDSIIKENILSTNNINSSEVYESMCNFKPDVIIVRGTTIIKNPLINYDAKYFLNIHGAIVPNYRNVHSLFWSYYYKDFSNMGSSILHITEGIDNGNVALMSNLKEKPKNLKYLHLKILVLSNQLTINLIDILMSGKKIDSIEQNIDIEPFYGQTPKFSNFFKLYV
jgi:methionyl-tRNA formyltransferase